MTYFSPLSIDKQSQYTKDQSAQVRIPSYHVEIEGMPDIDDSVIFILSDKAYENEIVLHSYVSHCYVICDNANGQFFSNGVSVIPYHAQIRIYLGFNDNNIKVWEGFIYQIDPLIQYGYVNIYGYDAIGLIKNYVFDEYLEGDTLKDVIDNVFARFGVSSAIPATGIMNLVQYNTYVQAIDGAQLCQRYIELTGWNIYIDRDGRVNANNPNNTNKVDYEFNEDNVLRFYPQNDLPLINDYKIQYGLNKYSNHDDWYSQIVLGKEGKYVYNDGFNNETISESESGATDYVLSALRTAFKVVTPSDAMGIDSMLMMLKQDGDAEGYAITEVWSDNGSPASLQFQSAEYPIDKILTKYSWIDFHNVSGMQVSLSTPYWLALNISGVSNGSLTMRVDGSISTLAQMFSMATIGASWATIDNQIADHRVYGSGHAFFIGEQVVSYYGQEHKRFIIRTVGNAHLNFYDNVNVALSDYGINGRYNVERIRHFYSSSFAPQEILDEFGISGAGGFVSDIFLRK